MIYFKYSVQYFYTCSDIILLTIKLWPNILDHYNGSRSINREKIFIYDLALLLTKELKANHLGFLIHDNIFDVDQDTLVRSLNYLYEHVEGTDTQYILTLNRDKLSSLDFQQLTFDFKELEVASFTKMNRFLGVQYQEQ